MSEMIERVAIKVFLSHGYPEDDWVKITSPARDEFRRCARAAIEAMREPTSEMVRFGETAGGHASGQQLFQVEGRRFAAASFTAMIDAVLK